MVKNRVGKSEFTQTKTGALHLNRLIFGQSPSVLI